MAGFRIETRLRPCYAKLASGKIEKALFHCWSQESTIYAPSIRRGGHNGGVVSGIVGIVELENGAVTKVHPERIRFVPGEFDAYAWNYEEVTNEETMIKRKGESNEY